jgi:hypothetical protein
MAAQRGLNKIIEAFALHDVRIYITGSGSVWQAEC